MHASLSVAMVVLLTACSPAGDATTGSSAGASGSTSASTSTSTSSDPDMSTGINATGDSPTTGMPGTGTTTGSTTGTASTTGTDSTSDGTTGTASTTGTDSTDSTTGTTGTASTTGSSTGGGGVVASFACVETTLVEPFMQESISGAFLADGTPVDVTAVMVKGGAVDFHVDVALPVDPNDPNAADVAAFETWLTMTGWDVNVNDMTDDRRYFFVPEGAQNVAIFQAFYYKIYGNNGNGQFEFACKLL